MEQKKRVSVEIDLMLIDAFPNHPFKVIANDDLAELVESIRAYGVLTPCLVRKKKDGRYELISGHRRKKACEILGIPTLRCEIVEVSKDESTIIMVESNFHRNKLLPSEKAFAYKMRLEAMKMLISRIRANQKNGRNFNGIPVEYQLEKARSHLVNSYSLSEEEVLKIGDSDSRRHDHRNGGPVGHLASGKKARDIVAMQVQESATQIRRYIRLTELIPELLNLVDEGIIALRPAVEISYLGQKQKELFEIIDMEQRTPTHAQAIRMRKLFDEGKLTKEAIAEIMLEDKPNQVERLSLNASRIKAYLPPELPARKYEDYIVNALKVYVEHYS